MINKQTTLDLNGPILSFTQQPSSATLSSGGSTTLVGVATATYPTQDPANPAVNTGSIVYRWYVDGYGPLNDGSISALGMTVSGSTTTTLSISNAVSPAANGRRFYLLADHIPSAYSQPIGSAVTVGTARSTGSAFNDPKSSNIATLTVRPIISVTSNPSNQEVAEGDFATFTASGSSTDGTSVSVRWLLNGFYLSDNGSTIFGSNTNTLRISLQEASSNLISAEISHPTASNGPLRTNSALFTVVVARAVINFETFEDDGFSLKSTGNFDLTQQNGNYFQFDSGQGFTSVSMYPPERDILVRITLAGAAGGSIGSRRGGCGGVTVFDTVLRKNIEYVLKIGSVFGLNSYPAGGWTNGGGMSIFYRQAQVIAVSGGGGGAGRDGRGGDGGAAGQAGEPGQGRVPGAGGRAVVTGALGTSGFWQGGFSTPHQSPLGGKLSSCTIGGYWRDQGYSPCENMGNVQLYNVRGNIFNGSATIQRGFKAGLGYRNNGGVAPSTTNGAGGGGAYGGSASTAIYSGYYSGGGGGSGYWNGEGTLRLAVAGGNCSTRGYVRVELLTINTGLPSINPPAPTPPPPCSERYYTYRYGGGGGFGSCPVGFARRGRWYESADGVYYPIWYETEGTIRQAQDIYVPYLNRPAHLWEVEGIIQSINVNGSAYVINQVLNSIERRNIIASGDPTDPNNRNYNRPFPITKCFRDLNSLPSFVECRNDPPFNDGQYLSGPFNYL